MIYQKKFKGDVAEFGRVAVIYGGFSAERAISLQSGQAIVNGLQRAGVDVVGIDVSEKMVAELTNITCDRIFIALHGIGGEDGKVQSVLELLDICYTGSGVTASAIAIDKLKTKLLWLGAGLPTPEFKILDAHSNWAEVHNTLGGDIFVKPVREGSSLGMSYTTTVEELESAYSKAASFDDTVIAERKIIGREFTVSVLDGVALPAIELKVNNTFYDYNAKYESDETQYLCPCELSEDKERELQNIALQAFDVLGCQGWGRIDFMQDEHGDFYLLEANTVPGMTDHSLVPMSAKAAGLDFSELLIEILTTTQ